MGRYSDSCEQRFRQLFEHGFDWLEFNTSLMWRGLGRVKRKAIAIDASFISKAGKKTPYIGKFWSGCDSSVKRGLSDTLKSKGDGYNLADWYLDVLNKFKDKLLAITCYVVADAWFSKSTFINKLLAMGFHLISLLRDDSALWYSHNGVRTGKRGRPRGKGEKIDFDNPDLSTVSLLTWKAGGLS